MKVKILVVDDHDLVRMGIVRMLEDVPEFEVVGAAKTGEEALQFCRKQKPDVVLMDVKMPGMGGIEATRKLLTIDPDIKVVAVTAYDDDLYPERLIKAGALGYITKGADVGEMIEAINSVRKGVHYMSAAIAQQLALKRFHGRDNENPFDQLSARELQTAMMIISGNKVPEIAEIFCVSPKTVNSYRYRIFDKLGVSSDVELALLAVRHNLLELESV